MSAKAWKLLGYQKRWVRDRSPVKVCEKSRRIGLSWASAYDAVVRAAAGRGDVSYMSFNKDMTEGFVGDCADWAEKLHGLALHIGQEVLSDDKGRAVHKFSLSFPSGKKIEALTSLPRNLRSRGRPGDRAIIDEAAHVDDIDEIIKAAMAITTWGGSVEIISTHNGEQNPFNLLVRDIKNGNQPYGLHTIPLADALADGLYKRILAVQRHALKEVDEDADVSHLAWSQEAQDAWERAERAKYRYPWQAAEELDCVPADGEGAWISLADYMACEDDAAGKPELYGGNSAWLGYDVARIRDLAVQSAFERVGEVLWLREMGVFDGETFEVQYAGFDELMQRYRVVRAGVDATGMGLPVAERLQRRWGDVRVEAVTLSPDRRLAVATALREAFEARIIRVPPDPVLRADVRSMRRAPSAATGAPRLASVGGDTDGHADRFWSMALACAAAAEGTLEYGYTPARRGSDASGRRGWLRPDHSGDRIPGAAAAEDRHGLMGRADFGGGTW